MESWDDENFEPTLVTPAVANLNKWEGEDEDDDVKESWEDEEEEKAQRELKTDEVKPKKKTIAEKIAEKERLKREQMEKKLREQEDEMTPEEKLRIQKESDLKIALETTFGLAETNHTSSAIDGLSLPDSKEEFAEFTETLSKKLLPLAKNPEYPTFTENLVRNLCASMSSLDIKRIKNTLDNLFLEKQKIEKGDKTKKSKGKGKAKLKLDDGNPLSAYVDADYDEFDDFM